MYLTSHSSASAQCTVWPASVCRRFRPRRPVSQTKPAPAFLHASNSQLEVPISISDSHSSRPTSSNLSRFTTSARVRQYHRRSYFSSSLLTFILSVSSPFQVFFLPGPVAYCTLVLTSPPRSRHVAAEQLSGAAGVRNCDDDDNDDDDNNTACDCTLLCLHMIYFIFHYCHLYYTYCLCICCAATTSRTIGVCSS